jgi:hypothetical protein
LEDAEIELTLATLAAHMSPLATSTKETPMNIENVLEQIKNTHAVPVPCKFPTTESDIEFAGTLVEFLAFVEQHCHKPVAMWRHAFDEHEFQTEIEAVGEDADEYIDVRDLDPKLRRFEQYLKTDIGYRLLAWLKDTNATIGFDEFEPWLSEFLNESKAAEKAYLAKQNEAVTQEREIRRQAEQALLAQVEALIDDPAFRALTTQRAMYIYATEKIEGLSELREGKVKQVIATMAVKIGLRKHRKGD